MCRGSRGNKASVKGSIKDSIRRIPLKVHVRIP